MQRGGGLVPVLLVALATFAVVYLLFGDAMTGGTAGGSYTGASDEDAPSYLAASAVGLEAKGTAKPSAADIAAKKAAEAAKTRVVLKSEGVFGIVTDARGNPIAKASVMLLPDPVHLRNRYGVPDGEPIHTALTNEQGEFVVGPSPESGFAKVRAEAAGYAPTIQRVLQRGARVDLILDKGGALEVKLLDAKGEAVANAKVIHMAGTVVTQALSDEAGLARFQALPTGTGTLIVTKEGHGAVRDNSVAVAPGETEKRTMVMPDGIELSGRVIDAETERPIDGASVTVRYPQLHSMEEQPAASTDEEGAFKVTGYVSGNEQVIVRVNKEGFAESRMWRNAQTKGEMQVKLLKSGEAFEGSVQTRDRQPVAGVRITYAWQQNEKPEEVPEAVSDKDGAFMLPVPSWGGPGSGWTIVAISKEHGFGTGQASVPRKGKPPAKEIEITLGGMGTVKGIVTDKGGAPVQGAVVSLAADWAAARTRPGRKAIPWNLLRIVSSGNYYNLTAVTGEDGAYTIAGVPALEYKVSASFGLDQVTLEEAVSVTAGDTADADVALGEGGTIEGWILDSDEKPVAGAYVYATAVRQGGNNYGWWRSQPTARAQSDGKFVLRGISDATYNLWASASGYGSAQEKNIQKGDKEVTMRLKARGWIVGKLYENGVPFRGMFTVTAHAKRTGGSSRNRWRGRNARTFNTDDGYFEIKGINAGEYALTASTPAGMVTLQPATVAVVDGRASREARLELMAGASLSGTVRNDETGRGMSNVWVYANPARTGEGPPGKSAYAQTDRQGRYEIKGLSAGPHTITVWLGGTSITKQVEMSAGAIQTLDLVKEAPGSVTFIVTDEEGTPIEGARPNIRLVSGGSVGVNMAQLRKDGIIEGNVDWRLLYNTNIDGVLTRYHVPPGIVKVSVNMRGYTSSSQTEIDVRSGQTTEVRVTLKRAGSR